jgi:hypothetical protein
MAMTSQARNWYYDENALYWCYLKVAIFASGSMHDYDAKRDGFAHWRVENMQ